MKNKLLSLFLALTMVVVAIPTMILSAFAENVTSGECGDGLTWTLDLDTSVLTVSGTGAMADYSSGGAPWYSNKASITKVVIEKGVTSIGSFAFYNCNFLTNITIPASVESVGTYAFGYCRALNSITLPASVESIGLAAFYNCTKLKSVSFEANSKLMRIDSSVFYNCTELTSITIPASVRGIGSEAFYNCIGLESIMIPASVMVIDSSAFSNCSELESITVAEENAKYHSSGNCLIETASKELILGCKNSVIPSSVTYIGSRAFYGCTGLTSITIPASVIDIRYMAFSDCTGLTSITIPEGVHDIQFNAFSGCENLISITIPTSVTSIGNSAFANCTGLESITVAEGNAKYHSDGNCLIETATKTLILGCKNSVIPADGSVTSIGNRAFYNCSGLTSITIPASVTSIGNRAFYGCTGLTSITIPASVTSIGDYAFYGCTGLTSITIPASVTSIGDYAFYGCTGLTSITIPASVTSIGDYAFYGCTGLTRFIYCGIEEKWNAIEKGTSWKYNVPATVQFHNYVDRKCTECGELNLASTIVGASVNLGEDITIIYYADIPSVFENAQMKFTMNGKETVVGGEYDDISGYTVFVFDNIAPQCMGDNIKAELIYDGGVIAEKDEYSILQNAENLLERYSYDEKTVDLVKAMLNYGAAAQKYAKYKTDALVNEGYVMDYVAPSARVSVRDVQNNVGNGIFKATGVYFNSVNRLYVKILADEKPTVTVNGIEALVEANGDGEWIVYTDGIYVVDFATVYTFVITSNENLPTFTYSVNSYTYAKQTSDNEAMKELATATFAYGSAAKNYLGMGDVPFNSEDDNLTY